MRLLLVVAAVTITANWATFIYGVNSGRVVETSLGYFINPLVTVLLGVLVLGERLRGPAVVRAGDRGAGGGRADASTTAALPWIALVLAFSFGTYALAKKSADVGAGREPRLRDRRHRARSPWSSSCGSRLAGRSTFTSEGLGHALLIPTTGIVTAVPLILFGAAAVRVSMVSLGLLQYLAPIIQFTLGLLVFDETMTPGRWVGFVLVWTALAVFTVEALRHRGRQLVLTAAAAA